MQRSWWMYLQNFRGLRTEALKKGRLCMWFLFGTSSSNSCQCFHYKFWVQIADLFVLCLLFKTSSHSSAFAGMFIVETVQEPTSLWWPLLTIGSDPRYQICSTFLHVAASQKTHGQSENTRTCENGTDSRNMEKNVTKIIYLWPVATA